VPTVSSLPHIFSSLAQLFFFLMEFSTLRLFAFVHKEFWRGIPYRQKEGKRDAGFLLSLSQQALVVPDWGLNWE
jgi:hypothetical protein